MSEEQDKLLEKLSEIIDQGNRRRDQESDRGLKHLKITSVSIPVKVYDRGKSLRVYLNVEAEIRDERDILRIAQELYDMRLDPDYYVQRDQGNRYSGNNRDYRGNDYGNRRR